MASRKKRKALKRWHETRVRIIGLLAPPDDFDKEKFKKDWMEAMSNNKQLPFTTGYDEIKNKIT